MTDVSTEGILEQRLDDVLRRANAAQDVHNEVRRAEREAANKLSNIEGEAQRVRLALFALQGKEVDAAKANTANSERRRELRSERR